MSCFRLRVKHCTVYFFETLQHGAWGHEVLILGTMNVPHFLLRQEVAG
jgi:hypothetical protein